MFTGIVADVGSVRNLIRRGEDALLEVGTSLDLDDVQIGDSIAVSGACLTVTTLAARGFTADVSSETLSRTTLKDLKPGNVVNLEKALRIGDRFGGHIVLGHVDGIGRIIEKTVHSQSVVFCFEIGPEIDRYIVVKGSITVDGISLTVNRCEKNRFYVNIIPHTAARTTLGAKKASDIVNIETDILAKYVERLMAGEKECGGPLGRTEGAGGEEAGSSRGVDLALLSRHGFLK